MEDATHYINWTTQLNTWLRVEGPDDEIVKVGDSHLSNLEEKIKGMSIAGATDLLSRSLPNSFVKIQNAKTTKHSSWMSNTYHGKPQQ